MSPVTTALLTVRPGPYLLAIKTAGGHLYAFDVKGRFLHAYGDQVAFRRSPDHEIVEKRMLPGPRQSVEICCHLDAAEQKEMQATIRNVLTAARVVVTADQTAVAGGAVQSARALSWIEAALAWDFKALAVDGRRFLQLYRYPLGPLAPDRHQTLVLQVTAGQADRTDNLPPLQDPADFAAHARAVRAFFGPDPLRRELFLANANAVLHPLERLRAYFDCARGLFPEALCDVHGGFSTYVDGFAAAGAHPLYWSELAALGLRRVYVGLDDHCNQTDVFLHPEYAQPLVEALHKAGVAVGIMVTRGTATDDGCLHLMQTLGLRGRDVLYIPQHATPFHGLSEARQAGLSGATGARVVLYAPHYYVACPEGSGSLGAPAGLE